MKPVISATPFVGNVVKAKFVRGNTGDVRIETSVDRGPWTSLGNFFKSPAPLDIPQNADSLPRHVQIRARYLMDNTPVGNVSDVVTVQSIP